ncbi:MAG: hypothetical protein AAGH57_11475 [Pseudomonadota bacterium]
MIEAYFESGRAADSVLFVLALEAGWLARRGWSWRRIAKLLGPALFLVLAVRAALVGASWHWIALALAASFPLHLADVAERFRSNQE